jgi:DNA-directed RNA polymerase sigma subunit (sigma70/sigma32)
LKAATQNSGLIKINHGARTRAREKGDATQFEALDHLLSLDEQMEWFETDDLEEPHATPLTPAEAAPPRDPVLRAQIEMWLSYLSPRAQAILDDNERRHTTAEIARLLGLDRRLILTTERGALTRLRALATGKATLGRKNGKPCILYPHAHNR